jgi:transcriptional regulator with XRE-family HTH domain
MIAHIDDATNDHDDETKPEAHNAAGPSDDNVRKAKLRMIAGRIAEMRRDRGWSQAELARRAGLNRNVVNTTENESSFPTRENLERMARALSVELSKITDVYVEEAHHRAPAALNITEAKNRPGFAWIQVNRLVRSTTALKIYQLIAEDDADATDRG